MISDFRFSIFDCRPASPVTRAATPDRAASPV
jgi:hypothetical protein